MIYKTEAGGREILRRYDDVLAQWPVRAGQLRLPTREGETFVLTCGVKDAPPLLLFHGSGTNTAMWMGDVAMWAKHFRVYAVDLIGEPGHSAPSRPPLDSEAYALWLDDVLEGLGVERAAVVGASLGGWLAVDYATRRPHRVERLALLCPGGIGRQKFGFVLKALLYKPFGQWGMHRTLKAVAGIDVRETPEFAEYMALTFTEFLPRRDRLPVFSDEALRAADHARAGHRRCTRRDARLRRHRSPSCRGGAACDGDGAARRRALDRRPDGADPGVPAG